MGNLWFLIVVFFSPFFQLLADEVGCQPDDICDFELQACDTQPSIIAGATKEFIYSGRLDNLCMSFCSLKVIRHVTLYFSFCLFGLGGGSMNPSKQCNL